MALDKLKKWIGTQAMTAFFDQLNDNVDATNAVIDLAEQNAATVASHLAESATQFARLASYNRPVLRPYDSEDNGWRTITGIGFYSVGTAGGYPTSNGTLIHISLSPITSIVFQMFLGNSGQLWTRRVIASANFADVEWVAV